MLKVLGGRLPMGVLHLLLQLNFFMFCNSAKILMLPANFNSHFLYFSRLGEGLSKLGHTVELFAPSNGHVPSHLANENFTITQYDVKDETPFANSREMAEAMIKLELSGWKIRQMWKSRTMFDRLQNATQSDCVALMENKFLVERIHTAGFQFAIMDPIAPECYYLLPYSMGIKYATFSISGKGWFYRLNRQSALVPAEHTFPERIKSFLFELGLEFMFSSNKEYAKRYISNVSEELLPGAQDLMRNTSFWLYLEHLVLNGAKSNMPNTVSVGDIMAGQPGKPLPSELDEFLNHSPDGALVVSFGSLFDYAAELASSRFCEAFKRIKYGVIWKLKNSSMCGNSENVKILPWIPQNDLLAHGKVRLLITHGGFNSMLEAVHHATPVIVFPLGGDQPGHANMAAKKGFGLQMRLSDFEAEDLVSNINRIFEDPSFARQASIASGILKDRQNKPAERVSFLINHVIKYGDQHLRSDAFQLSLFEFLQFDIFCFFSVIGLAVLMLVIFCLFKLVGIIKTIFISTKTKLD